MAYDKKTKIYTTKSGDLCYDYAAERHNEFYRLANYLIDNAPDAMVNYNQLFADITRWHITDDKNKINCYNDRLETVYIGSIALNKKAYGEIAGPSDRGIIH